MIYALDTEFIEDGNTIDLVSIGLAAEDGRTFYRQVIQCDYGRANDFVRIHVLPRLSSCPMGKKNAHWSAMSTSAARQTGQACPWQHNDCPWQWAEALPAELQAFVGESPVFLGYYCAYDWVAICQLFGAMVDLPSGWPYYCIDLRQWLNDRDLRHLTQPEDMDHHALLDAEWIMETYLAYQHKAVS